MTTPRYFVTGCTTALSFRAIAAVVYCVTTALALVPALSLRSALASAFATSAATLDLARGFDFTVVGDLLQIHGKEFSAALGGVLPALLLSSVVNLFFAGGLIAASRSHEGSVQEFFRTSARYFGRLVRLELIVGVLALLLFVGLSFALALLHGWITSGAMSEWPTVWALLIDAVTVSLALFVLSLVVDYSRIAVIMEEESSAWRGFVRGVSLLGTARLAPAILSFWFLITLGIVAAAFLGLSALIESVSGLALAVLVALQQVFVLLRVFLRVASYAAETNLYEEYSFVPFNLSRVAGEGILPGRA
jgi:hypothetical protein